MALTAHRRGRPPRYRPPATTEDEEEQQDTAEAATESEADVQEQSLIDGPMGWDSGEATPTDLGPSKFVRVLGDMVGRFPRDSILPAITFEYLDSLIAQGALAYDHTATQEHIAGDASLVQLLSDLQQAAAQVVPTAPWANASAANLLGAHYVPLMRSSTMWTINQTVAEPRASIPMGVSREQAAQS